MIAYRYNLKYWSVNVPRNVGYIYYTRALFGHAALCRMFWHVVRAWVTPQTRNLRHCYVN